MADLPTGILLGLVAAPLLAFGAGWVCGHLCGWREAHQAVGPRPRFWACLPCVERLELRLQRPRRDVYFFVQPGACPHCGEVRHVFRCDPKPVEVDQ